MLLQCHVIDSDVDMDAAQRAMQEYTQVKLMNYYKGLCKLTKV